VSNSLKDALKAVLDRAGGMLSSSVKSNKKEKKDFHSGHHHFTEENSGHALNYSEDELEGLQFADIMASQGVEKLKFANSREPLLPCHPAKETPFSAVKKNKLEPSSQFFKSVKSAPKGIHPANAKQSASVPKAPITTAQENNHSPGISVNTPSSEKTGPSPVPTIQEAPDYQINLTEPVTPHPSLEAMVRPKEKKHRLFDGAKEQLAESQSDPSELVIGLDFGTSSVKVVIGDRDREIAYAVPFFDETGLSSFLLPSRVWLDSDGYSLVETGHSIRDLKLKMVERSCSTEIFSHSAAFLALVIRHARNWLFSEKADTYRQTHIYWSLALGLPAENYADKTLDERFKKLASAAWILSRTKNKSISLQQVQDVCANIFNESLEDVEIDVVPELTAQVYGFLNSTRFDPDGKNIFMLVDVGAGTVDSSIFHAKRGKGKKLEFEYFSNFVEFNGVENLHTDRVKWLKAVLPMEKFPLDVSRFIKQMELFIDFLDGIPESLNDYFSGLKFTFSTPEDSPDESFFSRVKLQVLNKTLKQAKPYVESEQEFAGIPLFLCGGGSRMKFYKRLETELKSHPNANWFRFIPSQLEIPEILSVPGVSANDFDRLSVAFGLSFLDLGKFARGQLQPERMAVTTNRNRCPGCGAVGTCYCG